MHGNANCCPHARTPNHHCHLPSPVLISPLPPSCPPPRAGKPYLEWLAQRRRNEEVLADLRICQAANDLPDAAVPWVRRARAADGQVPPLPPSGPAPPHCAPKTGPLGVRGKSKSAFRMFLIKLRVLIFSLSSSSSGSPFCCVLRSPKPLMGLEFCLAGNFVILSLDIFFYISF